VISQSLQVHRQFIVADWIDSF